MDLSKIIKSFFMTLVAKSPFINFQFSKMSKSQIRMSLFMSSMVKNNLLQD